jgi:hypothetical protein
MSVGAIACDSDSVCTLMYERQMVVFDQNSVPERSSMILPAAKRDGPFLKCAPTRQGLPGIKNADGVSTNGVTEPLSECRDAGQVLKKIQRDSFSLKYRSTITVDLEQRLTILGWFSVMSDDG